jgi:hypothetical protein
MRYVVEARYINNQPRLRVLDADRNTVCLEWNMQIVEAMLETGEIKRDDFLKPERYGMKLLVKNLFLLACTEKMKEESLSFSTLGINIAPKCNRAPESACSPFT